MSRISEVTCTRDWHSFKALRQLPESDTHTMKLTLKNILEFAQPIGKGTNPPPPAMYFVYQPKMHGELDGSAYQGEQSVSLWLADEDGYFERSLEVVEGPETLVGAFVPADEVQYVRGQVEYTYYDVRLVEADGFEAGALPGGVTKENGWIMEELARMREKREPG